MAKTVDMNTWERAGIYDFFSAKDYPFYSVTFPVDVTKVLEYAKKNGLSVYHVLIWLCTKSAQSIFEFRLRIHDGILVEAEDVSPSFTHMKKGAGTFQIVTVPYMHDINAFCMNAKKCADSQTDFIDFEAECEDMIFFSCLPWMDITSLTNERDFDKDDLIPRIAWGQFYEENGKTMVHMNLDINHRTIDGYHLGLFKKALDENINEL